MRNSANVFIVLALSSCIPGMTAFGEMGGEVDNGGDTVQCSVSGENHLVGYFSLDYLLTYRRRTDNADVVDRPWEASRERISTILREKFPSLGQSFDEFTANIFNTSAGHARFWNEASFGLEDISDERIIRKLPPNCYTRLPNNSIQFIQSVIRVQRPESILYEYDFDILDDLKNNAPLQFSFLMVHEWLWDFTRDVQIIRDVNRFIHSTEFEHMATGEDMVSTLASLGVSLSYRRPVPVCLRSPLIVGELESKSGVPCTEMTNLDDVEGRIRGTSDTYSFTVLDADLHSLRLGDLSHLDHLGGILISNSRLEKLDPFDFSGLPMLTDLNLADNNIGELPRGIFRDLRSINRIVLSGNRIEKLPPAFFTTIFKGLITSGISVSLAHNRLRELPADLCVGVPPRSTPSWRIALDLTGNPGPFDARALEQQFPCVRITL